MSTKRGEGAANVDKLEVWCATCQKNMKHITGANYVSGWYECDADSSHAVVIAALESQPQSRILIEEAAAKLREVFTKAWHDTDEKRVTAQQVAGKNWLSYLDMLEGEMNGLNEGLEIALKVLALLKASPTSLSKEFWRSEAIRLNKEREEAVAKIEGSIQWGTGFDHVSRVAEKILRPKQLREALDSLKASPTASGSEAEG